MTAIVTVVAGVSADLADAADVVLNVTSSTTDSTNRVVNAPDSLIVNVTTVATTADINGQLTGTGNVFYNAATISSLIRVNNANNAYLGTTTADGDGVLVFQTAGTISPVSAFVMNMDTFGQINLANTTHVVGSLNYISGGEGVASLGGGIYNGTLSTSGPISLQGGILGATGATLTGSGAITKLTNAAFSIESRVNTTGGLTVQEGNLTLSNASNALSGGITVTGGTLTATTTGALGSTTNTLSVSGSGTVALGASTPTLAGVTLNTSSGITGSGTITVNAPGTYDLQAGSIAPNLAGSAAITKSTAGTVTLAGTVSTTGGVSVQAGNLTLTGTNSYSGGTTITGGTLQVGNGGATGTLGSGGVSNSGTLSFNRDNTSALIVSNDISGTGSVTQAGTGTTILTGTNSYGATTINSGVLQIGNGGATGTLGSGNVTNNAALTFNRSNTLTYAGDISGTGSVTQAGTGTTILTGTNSYGATTINSGVLQIGNGGTSGTLGSGNVTNNAALSFNRSDALTVANAISGTGSVTQAGTGTTVLTGTNNYSGATAVNGGTLSVNGSITSAVTVNNGGTLGGNGTVGATTIANGGSLGPGNSIGTLNVNGNLNFNGGSTYVVEVDPTSADRTNATGSANLTGGTVSALFAAGVYTARTYTILSAAGGLGGTTFAGLTNTNLPAGFTSSLSYTTNNVILNLTAVLGTTTPGLNPNQQAITTALNTAFNAGGLPGAFIPLFGLTGAQLTAALDQLSPQIYGASEIAALFASQQFTTDLMSCRTPGDGAASIIREGQCLWVKGRERVLDVDQSGNDLGLRDRTASVSAGLQVSLGGNWSGGLALGYDDTETNSGNATADGERFNAGAALKYTAGPLQLAAAISGGWGNADVERFISVPGLAGQITGTSDVDAYTAMLRAAYVIEMSGVYLKPLADLSVTRLSLDGTAETGGAAALALQGSDETVVTISPALEVGSNERADWIMPGAWFRPYARAGFSWRDEDRFDVTASFLAVPQPFNTTMELDRITADVAAGFDVIGANGSALKLEYSGRYASDLSDSSISVKGSLPF